MESLVGYTGFVGSNLCESGHFEGLYNSKNVIDAFGTEPDLIFYAGVTAEMFLANRDAEKDLAQIKNAIENIKKINAKCTVLISTISVYGKNAKGDENTQIDKNVLSAYGKNRLFLEEWVEENCKNYLIVRLPALYGKNLRKNFIYDYINFVPKLLKKEKFFELAGIEADFVKFYEKKDENFFVCKNLSAEEKSILTELCKNVGFSALNFTDSRSSYQFYNLKNLYGHIKLALELGIKKLNITTEPIVASELYEFLEKKPFVNALEGEPFDYDVKSVHAEKFGGVNGYLYAKDVVMRDVGEFVEGWKI